MMMQRKQNQMPSMFFTMLTVLIGLSLLLAACGGDAAPAETADTGGATSGDACAVENLALHEAGKLTVATGEPVFPPWMMDDEPSNGEGFESAVVYALASEMGFAAEDVQWVRTSFDEAIAPTEKPYEFNIQQ